MSQESDAKPAEKQSHGGCFHRLFGDAHHSAPSQPDDGGKTELNLDRHPGHHSPQLPHADRAALPAEVEAPAAARKLLGRLASGDETDAPQITTAKDWHVGLSRAPATTWPTLRGVSPTIA